MTQTPQTYTFLLFVTFVFFLLTTFALFFAVRTFQIDRFARLLCILCRLHELVPQHFFGDCEEHLFNVDIVFG